MKTSTTSWRSGSLLFETVMAVAVMAVIVPVAMMTMAKVCKSEQEVRAETMGLWTVPACLEEWKATGEPWALALAGDGTVLGSLTDLQYGMGLVEVGGKRVSYLCRIKVEEGGADQWGLRGMKLSLEYPAAAALASRHRIEFHSRMR